MATTGYQAGTESNAVLISYALETTFGVLPTVAFQLLRVTGSDTLAGTKTRTRPAELITTGEVAQAVTTQENAAGAVPFALSYGTFDDLIAGCLDSAWQTPVAIAGVAGDITITTVTNVLSSTTSNKFANIAVGQWIRTLGFTNAVNNGIFRVIAKASSQSITLSAAYTGIGTLNPVVAAFVTETPAGTAAQVRASTIVNGTTTTTFYLQKQFSSSLFLRYPGSYITTGSISGGVGAFLNGSFTFISQYESQATTTASTGSYLPAPTGGVHNPVSGFGGIFLAEAPIPAIVDSFTVTLGTTGAAAEYGMGNPQSQGILTGLATISGTLKVWFANLTLYNRFKSELLGTIEFITKDPNGNAYVITILNGALMNPKIPAGAQNSGVMATFDLEGNPQAVTGGTIQFDRLPNQ